MVLRLTSKGDEHTSVITYFMEDKIEVARVFFPGSTELWVGT